MKTFKLLPCSRYILLVSVILLVMDFSETYRINNWTRRKLHPVIYVPGFGGSKLQARVAEELLSLNAICDNLIRDNSIVWLTMTTVLTIMDDSKDFYGCWVHIMKLNYNKATHTTFSMPGVKVSTAGWGDPSYVDWFLKNEILSDNIFNMILNSVNKNKNIQYFDLISKALLELGFERNINIRSAPYDFRKAPNEQQNYFRNLKLLVEDTYSKNQNTPVVFVTHSMGGPMTLHFLQQQPQEWKDTYVKSFISLAGAWGGSTKALKIYVEGDNLDIKGFRPEILKEVLVTTPALAWMVPSPVFWSEHEVLVSTQTRQYTLSNIKDFFRDINQAQAWEMYKDILPYKTNFTAPGVEVHCLYGSGNKTLQRLHYNDGLGHEYGDGDGTISSNSLEGCERWRNMQTQNVHLEKFEDVDHMGILKNKRVIEYIKEVVEGKK